MNPTTKRASAAVTAAVMAALAGSAMAAPLMNMQLMVSATGAPGSYSNSLNLPAAGPVFFELVATGVGGVVNSETAITLGTTTAYKSSRSLAAPQALPNNAGSGLVAFALDIFGNASGHDTALADFGATLPVGDALGSTWSSGSGASAGVATPRASGGNDINFVVGNAGAGLPVGVSILSGQVLYSGQLTLSGNGTASISGRIDANNAANRSVTTAGYTNILADYGSHAVAKVIVGYNQETSATDPIFQYIPAVITVGGVTPPPGGLVLIPPTGVDTSDGQNVIKNYGTIMPGSPLYASIQNTSTSSVTGTYGVDQAGTSVLSSPTNPVAPSAVGLVQVGYGALTSINTKLTISDGGVSTNDTVTFQATVAANQDGEVDSAPIPKGGSYAGLHSTGGSSKGNTGMILGGTDNNNPNTIVKMSWANDPTNPTFSGGVGNGQPGFKNNPNIFFVSRILTLSGMDTDKFVLQMSYDPGMFPNGQAEENTAAAAGWIEPVTMDPSSGNWVPAWATNHGANTGTFHLGAFNAATDTNLGDWGTDPANHVAWAVLDHNSQFGVVPEPGTISVLGLSALGLCARRRRTVA